MRQKQIGPHQQNWQQFLQNSNLAPLSRRHWYFLDATLELQKTDQRPLKKDLNQ
jgi:hypothetical protein